MEPAKPLPVGSTAPIQAASTKPPTKHVLLGTIEPDPGPTMSVVKVKENIVLLEDKFSIIGGPETVLGQYLLNAKATIDLFGVGFDQTVDQALEKWKTNPLAAVVWGPIAVGSLIVGFALKAAIWTPVIALTALFSLIGAALGWLIGAGFGGSDVRAKGAIDGANLGAYIIAIPALIVAGVSITFRWIPLAVGLLAGLMLTREDTSEETRFIWASSFQSFQDTLEIFTGGMTSTLLGAKKWYTDKDDTRSYYSSHLAELVDAGANIYGRHWGFDTDHWGGYHLDNVKVEATAARELLDKRLIRLHGPPAPSQTKTQDEGSKA